MGFNLSFSLRLRVGQEERKTAGEEVRGAEKEERDWGEGKIKMSTTRFSFKILNCDYSNQFLEPTPPLPTNTSQIQNRVHPENIQRRVGKTRKEQSSRFNESRPHPHHPSMVIEQIY